MKHLQLSTAILFLIMTPLFSLAQQPIERKHLNLENGVAIKGYDPVSYFTGKKPIKGTKEYSFVHLGTTYQFATEENLNAFKSTPEKFQPEFGGWCAFAMSVSGEKVEVDPETFKIIDGKNYLFYNFYFTNTLKKWNQDEANLKPVADQNWAQILGN